MQKEKTELHYASTSASLYNFLGRTDVNEHVNVYRSVVRNAAGAIEDLVSFVGEKVNVIDPADVLTNMSKRPPVCVMFHTGSFYSTFSFLLMKGHQIYGLSDTDSMEKSYLANLTETYSERYSNQCRFTMVNVEKEGAIFEIIRQLKKGHPAFGYIDGNKGIGGQTKHNENMLDVRFLNGKVKVRKGLPYLAYLTKSPLVLILTYTEGGQRYIKFNEPFEIEAKNKEEYCERAMEMIFDKFGEHVKKYWDQWSNWPYVHNWTDLEYFKEKLKVGHQVAEEEYNEKQWIFNAARFSPLRYSNNLYLFDRAKYLLIPVEEQRINLFSYKTNQVEKERIIKEMLEGEPEKVGDLINRQILIEA